MPVTEHLVDPQPAAVFSQEEQAAIMHYLGYPKQAGAILAGAQGYRVNNYSFGYLESSLLRLSEEGAAHVREALRELRCIDQQLTSLRSKATVKRTGDVELDIRGGRKLLLGERRRMIEQMAMDLAVPINPASAATGPRVTNT